MGLPKSAAQHGGKVEQRHCGSHKGIVILVMQSREVRVHCGTGLKRHPTNRTKSTSWKKKEGVQGEEKDYNIPSILFKPVSQQKPNLFNASLSKQSIEVTAGSPVDCKRCTREF